MQLKVKFYLPQPITLPINNNQQVQGMIYHLLRDGSDFSQDLHDEGSTYGGRNFKLFTFGQLHGPYRIHGRQITYHDEITLNIHAINRDMLYRLMDAFDEKEVILAGQRLQVASTALFNRKIKHHKLLIRMDSPVTVHSTLENNQTTYYQPGQLKFEYLVNENFRRKYTAYTGQAPDSDVFLEMVHVEAKHKFVTRFKDILITGWRGEYQLTGKPEYLDFLYNTGLGARNSIGFGLFKIIKEEE